LEIGLYDEHGNLYAQISTDLGFLQVPVTGHTSGSGGPSEWSATSEKPATIVTCCSWDYGYAISTIQYQYLEFSLPKNTKFCQCQDTGGKDPDPSIPVMPRDFVISSQVRTEICV